ncbi:MAG: hypothetical protein WKF96_16720 [Solirubrobacteraceae bacterium]
MSDEAAERLLSPGDPTGDAASPLRAVVSELRAAGQSPPSEAVAERHLAAIVSEVRRPSEAAAGAAPRRAGRARVGALSRLLPPRLAGGFTAFTAFAALVVAGALPGPVQAAAADVLGVVGISVPDGRSVAKTDAEPVRRTVTPGDSSSERKAEQSQRAHPAVRHDDREERDRSETPAGREPDQADDGARESRDDEGDESSGDDGDERRPDTDLEPDDDGSSREPDAEEDPDDDGGVEGPGAGSIDTGDVDGIDEADDSGSGSEDRSGPSDTPLPEPDSTEAEPDSTEE